MKVVAPVALALVLLTACGHPNNQAGGQGILDRQDIVTNLETNAEPPPPSPSVFRGHAIDAERVAHAVGTLLASSDSGVVPSYLYEVERETGCGVQILTASSPSDASSLARLRTIRSRAIARLRQRDPTVTHIGGVLMPVVVPFKVEPDAQGAIPDQGWIGVIAVIRCSVGWVGQLTGQAPW